MKYNIIVLESHKLFEKYPNNIEGFLSNEMKNIDCKVSAKVCAGREQGYKGDVVEILVLMTEEKANDNQYLKKAEKTFTKACKEYTEYLKINIPF